MPKTLPPHIIARPDHPGQKMLALLDANHRLCFNDRQKRWEIWQFIWDAYGMRYEFITRLLADDRKGGYAEPGEWMIARLKARDSRYAGADEAWKNVKAELDAAERRIDEERQREQDRKLTDLNEHVAKDYLPEWQKTVDPHWTTRQRTEWDPEPVTYAMRPRNLREAIRAEAR